MEFITGLLDNTYVVWCAMAVVIFGLTQLFKLPIKALTKKITNERARHIVNIIILLIPFGLGILAEFLFNTYYLHTEVTYVTGLTWGGTSITGYAFVERFFGVKVKNPYDSADGQAVLELVDNVKADGKVDSNDKDAVKDFYDKIGK